jgi:Bacterial Ig-like domain
MSEILNNGQALVGLVGDPVAPAAPFIYTVMDQIIGPIALNGTTSSSQPTLSGRGVPGDIVTVYDRGVPIGSVAVLFSGNWTMKPVVPLTNGAHDLTATQTDLAGTTSAASAHFTFTVQSPPAPTFLTLSERTENGLGMVGEGGTTHDVNPALVFVAIVGNTYTLYDNGTLVGTMVATKSTTAWVLPNLADGAHNLNLTYATDAGTSEPLTLGFNVSGVSNAPVITGVVAADGPLEGNVAAGGLSTDGHPTINGTGHAGDTINVYDGAKLLGATLIDTTGHWSFKAETALANGAHSLTATETNVSGTSVASAAYPLSVTYIMITAVYDAQNHLVANGGTTQGAITVTGWISDASIGANGTNVFVQGGNMGGYWNKMFELPLTVVGNTFSVVVSKDSFTGQNVEQFLTSGTFSLGVQAWGSMGTVMTMSDPRLAYTITDDFTAKLATIAATHVDTSSAVDDTTLLAVHASASPVATQAEHHAVVGEHDTFKGTTGNAAVDLNVDPATYFKAATAHIQGGTDGVTTMHLTGDHQVLDLTSLSGATAAAKVSGIETIDLGGAHNMLKLSLVDVLNLAEPDLFQKDGKQQMLVNGSNGDSVDLSNSHVAGVTDGQWMQEGTAVVGGVTYNVYEHSGAYAELLVQQGVQTALHA